MTDAPRHPESPDPSSETDRLFGRVLDGEADPGELEAFRRALATDAKSWDTFSRLYRDHQVLSSAVGRAIGAADRIALPHDGGAPTLSVETARAKRAGWRSHLVTAGGWAAAIVFFALMLALPGSRIESQPTLRAEYISHVQDRRPTGRELDPVLLSVDQMPDGRWMVTIIRRPVEVLTLDEWREEFVIDPAVDE